MQIIDALKPLPGEMVLTKVTSSAFLSTNLCDLLYYNGIKSFLACGVWLHACVENTIRVGCDLGFFPTLVEDGAAATDEEFHKAAVRELGAMYCQVCDSEWILNHLQEIEK
jgi:nicotinamidase-related amidase